MMPECGAPTLDCCFSNRSEKVPPRGKEKDAATDSARRPVLQHCLEAVHDSGASIHSQAGRMTLPARLWSGYLLE